MTWDRDEGGQVGRGVGGLLRTVRSSSLSPDWIRMLPCRLTTDVSSLSPIFFHFFKSITLQKNKEAGDHHSNQDFKTRHRSPMIHVITGDDTTLSVPDNSQHGPVSTETSQTSPHCSSTKGFPLCPLQVWTVSTV